MPDDGTAGRLDVLDMVLQLGAGLAPIYEALRKGRGPDAPIPEPWGVDVDQSGKDAAIVTMSNGQRFYYVVREITGDEQIERGSFEGYWTPRP